MAKENTVRFSTFQTQNIPEALKLDAFNFCCDMFKVVSRDEYAENQNNKRSMVSRFNPTKERFRAIMDANGGPLTSYDPQVLNRDIVNQAFSYAMDFIDGMDYGTYCKRVPERCVASASFGSIRRVVNHMWRELNY